MQVSTPLRTINASFNSSSPGNIGWNLVLLMQNIQKWTAFGHFGWHLELLGCTWSTPGAFRLHLVHTWCF